MIGKWGEMMYNKPRDINWKYDQIQKFNNRVFKGSVVMCIIGLIILTITFFTEEVGKLRYNTSWIMTSTSIVICVVIGRYYELKIDKTDIKAQQQDKNI